MRTFKSILLFLIFTISLSQNILSISDASINAGESTDLDVSLSNADLVYGFQMDIQDWPD